MSLVIEAESPPLRMGEGGVVRVGGTRVSLDSIIIAYQRGESPESIADQYPAIPLADVFAVIGFYLRHRSEVEVYLVEREQAEEAVRQGCAARFSQEGLREKLLARRESQSHS